MPVISGRKTFSQDILVGDRMHKSEKAHAFSSSTRKLYREDAEDAICFTVDSLDACMVTGVVRPHAASLLQQMSGGV